MYAIWLYIISLFHIIIIIVIVMRSKNELLKYGLNAEIEFMYALNTLIDDENVVIKKTTNKYAPVDFIITNKQNDMKLYIELKSRTQNISSYDSFMIGRSKLNSISKIYRNDCVVLVWIDTHNHLFYKLYQDELLNSQIKCINGGDVLLIPKTDCRNSDISSLADCIKRYSNQILD